MKTVYSPWNVLVKYGNRPLGLLAANSIIRERAIRYYERRTHSRLLKNHGYPRQVQEDKFYMGRATISAMDKVFQGAKNAPQVRRALINSLILNIFLKRKSTIKEFKQQFGFAPPGFLVIGPGKFCNLKCTGCYA
ncbi:MAG: hypothetical protein KAW83_04820, partial [Dehalococcoidia bacterium]|nr:hypothetical protein [Dehalococcoidia bacterium]